MGGIFICYRREDTAGWAGRLDSDLQAGLAGVFIFRDVEDIPPGVKYDEYISQALGSCDVLIALIGPQWLTAKDRQGVRRLDDPNDFIALEIATCLRRDIRVIPALVGGARIPVDDELPQNIRALSRRQAYELSDSRWAADCRKLITDIAPLVRARPKIRRALLAAAAATLVVAGGGYGLWQWYTATSTTQRASARLTNAGAGSTTPEPVAGPRIVQREGGGNDGAPARSGQSSISSSMAGQKLSTDVAGRPGLPPKNPTRTSSAVAPSPGSTDPKDADQDKRDIDQLLMDYCSAYEALDIPGIVKVYPSAPAAFREQFRQYKSAGCTVTGPPKYVALDPQSGKAQIEVVVKVMTEHKAGGGKTTQELVAKARLARPKQRGGWHIEGISFVPKR
jgi:hypothetical protein